MNTKKNALYALIHLLGMFICIFCLTMIILLGGLPPIITAGVCVMTVVQGVGLFWYLSENSAPKNRFVRLLLFLIRLSVLAVIALAAYLTILFTSEFHSDLKPDAVGSISELDMEAVENAENCYVFQTGNLYIFFPQYQKIASVFADDYPSMKDGNITYFATSAFFREEKIQFLHENVVGAHAQDGVYYEGAEDPYLSAFTFYNGEAHFTLDDPDAAVKQAAENGGDGFEQYMALWEGEDTGLIYPGKLRCYRVLSELNGRICVIEGAVPMSYDKFRQAIQDIGVKTALYLDMGGKSTYSRYRNNDGDVVTLFNLPSPLNHQWVVFYK